MMQGLQGRYFVAGTDTEIGKTYVSCALLRSAQDQGLQVLGLKPVAAGADCNYQGQLENEDAVALKRASNIEIGMRELNPACLPEPLSPHIAASRAQCHLSVEKLVEELQPGLDKSADLILVEGAGGWRVPLSDSETMADLAIALALPVILVVGMRLGCLNHALLTAEAIRRDGLALYGWVANDLSGDMAAFEENVATLKCRIDAPMIATIAYGQKTV